MLYTILQISNLDFAYSYRKEISFYPFSCSDVLLKIAYIFSI